LEDVDLSPGGGTGTQVEPAKPKVDPGSAEAAGEALECLIDELQLCLRYHQSVFPARPVEKLVFIGGESRNAAICQRIARALRVGAQLGDPLARMVRLKAATPPTGVDMRAPQPGWAVPLGLCLAGRN
jgi:Tfp pilus assembly PilM family ATPase